MNEPSTTHDQNQTEPPLWSIGIAALIILLTPLVLYSLAPEGPIREGDTVFSQGEQRVTVQSPTPEQAPNDHSCLLDPNTPLIVTSTSHPDTDGLITTHVQGNQTGEWPFCPVHTEVLLSPHQVFQKPAMLRAVRDTLIGWFSR